MRAGRRRRAANDPASGSSDERRLTSDAVGPPVASAWPPVGDPAELVDGPLVRFWLGPADRPQVAAGARVAAGDPLVEQAREPTIAEVRVPPGLVPPEPGLAFDRRVALVG